MKKYIILINGSSCSGKSTLVRHFCAHEARLAVVSFDICKKLISDYDSVTDDALVLEVLFLISKKFIDHNLSLIIDCSAKHAEKIREYYSKLAVTHGLVLKEINLEASLLTLKKRLSERTREGGAYKIKRVVDLIQDYTFYIDTKNNSSAVFQTDKMTPNEIYEAIKLEMKNLTTD